MLREFACHLCSPPLCHSNFSVCPTPRFSPSCYTLILFYPKEGKSKNYVSTRTRPTATALQSPQIGIKDLTGSTCPFTPDRHASIWGWLGLHGSVGFIWEAPNDFIPLLSSQPNGQLLLAPGSAAQNPVRLAQALLTELASWSGEMSTTKSALS